MNLKEKPIEIGPVMIRLYPIDIKIFSLHQTGFLMVFETQSIFNDNDNPVIEKSVVPKISEFYVRFR